MHHTVASVGIVWVCIRSSKTSAHVHKSYKSYIATGHARETAGLSVEFHMHYIDTDVYVATQGMCGIKVGN